MRIVAGRWRGRRIRPPDDTRVRPTADRVREAWMSIVMASLVDARVLDLFAGSGALGIEALSRGAASADLVEISASGVRAIRENAEGLGAGDELRVHRADAIRFIARLEPHAFDVAFADPPYGHGLAKAVAERWFAVPFAAVLGIEHSSKEPMPEGDTRRYGDTAITFYRAESAVPSP
jgi:16S rRNA (guanine966-N2)-methyltransferase